ncbi:MAG: GlsB/YeaQ/YmgE family stress response membrane protein [Calditrichaeota bacterium]|nr:MAG: GlsB/YeaQ/YmgE family stress response membrane protein [Calditrichota bacterium]
MTLIWTILIGFVAGAVAKWLMPGKDPGGLVVTTLLGIGGAFLATLLGQFLGIYHYGERAGFIGAVIGAVLILWIYRRMNRRR